MQASIWHTCLFSDQLVPLPLIAPAQDQRSDPQLVFQPFNQIDRLLYPPAFLRPAAAGPGIDPDDLFPFADPQAADRLAPVLDLIRRQLEYIRLNFDPEQVSHLLLIS